MPIDDELHLLLQTGDERSFRRKREAFLASVVFHLVAVILIVVGPRYLLPRGKTPQLRRELDLLENSQKLGYLALPPDYQKLFARPRITAPPRRQPPAQTSPPLVGPKGLQAPQPEKKEEPAPQGVAPKPSTVPAQVNGKTVLPDSQQSLVAQQEGKPGGNPAGTEGKKPESSGAKSNLRDLVARLEVPGASIQSSLDKARKGGGGLGGGSPGLGGPPRIDKRMPDFSLDEPSILSDAQGVDFSSWLRILFFRVRDNWFAVIPEVIRSGLQGRVVLIFDVRRDGKVENLEVVRSAGMSPYDRAAISSIKLSEPFPNFPQGFSGARLTLQFIYLYNIRL